MRSTFARLLPTLRGFCGARRGNVAITFALAAIPMIGFVGAAVEYNQAVSLKTEFQSALDSTALMLAKEAATVPAAQLQSDATKFFNAMLNRPQLNNIQISATYSANGGSSITINGSATVSTHFAALVGFSNFTVAGAATTKWSSARLRVALVLDNTGSMAEHGKIGTLKTATTNLLAQLQSVATTNEDVYVSIIPFAKDVNLNPINRAAAWIDWTDWDANNGTCSKKNGNGSGTTQSTCSGTWTPDSHTAWNGCVADRGRANGPDPANYDTNVVAPTASNKSTLFSAEQYSSCPQAAMGLSYDWSSMNRLVNNMSAVGNTNQAIGLALGWMSLTGGGPFTAPAKDPIYTYSQNIILLSDGLNTQDRWYTSQSSINARQQMTCDNIKAAGITLYTIQVNTDGDPTSSLLQHCASSADKFYLVTSADQILPTFNSIGANLSKLYISR